MSQQPTVLHSSSLAWRNYSRLQGDRADSQRGSKGGGRRLLAEV
jgi:hypothetical protein